MATGTGQKSLAANNVFLHSVEVTPDKLSVKIFRQDITFESETIPCWSYVTDGFVAQRQKKSILTFQFAVVELELAITFAEGAASPDFKGKGHSKS